MSSHLNASPASSSPPSASNISDTSCLTASDYQEFHRAVCSNDEPTLAFAHYRFSQSSREIVVPSTTSDAACPVQWVDYCRAKGFFHRNSSLSRCLRYGRGVACFNLYPANKRDLKVNHLLWTVAQHGEYHPSDGNLLLENNVLSLAMPSKFFTFLEHVSEQYLKLCMLEVLALIAEDEDAEGLALMKSELEESVWDDLNTYMAVHSDQRVRIDSTTDQGFRLMRDVETLLRLCYLSPWKIDVYAVYVTPQDITSVLADPSRPTPTSPHSVRLSHEEPDRRLVRSSARRPVSTTTHSQRKNSSPRSRHSKRNIVFWKLFQDWRSYRKVLVHTLGISPIHATEAMLGSISRGTQRDAWDRAETILACANTPGNMLSALPREVVFRFIAPFLLLAESKE